MKKNKVLLIGWDAADWKIIGPLLAKGEMPALKKLIDRGVYGNMSTMNPPYSPMLWSSVATGKTPDKHGVLGFLELMPNMKGIRPVTVNSRKSRAIWNILHNQGYKSNLVGWWPSFPAEPINGVVVTDKFQKDNIKIEEKAPLRKGVIHPEALEKELEDLRFYQNEITDAHILPFIPRAKEIDQTKDNSLVSFSKIMSQNISIHCAATNLMRTTEWDFMTVYYDLIDHFCHAYMKFYPPKMNRIPQNFYELYNQCIHGAYKFQDMMLERTMDLVDDDTTIIVMSDHGYESGHKRILELPKINAAPALEHRQYGIFVAAGPNIKKNEKVFGLSLLDIAPTILNMFDLPVGEDMDGKVALDMFKTPKKPTYIDTWENIKGDFGEHKTSLSGNDQLGDQEALEELVALGYIEQPDEDKEIAILKTKCNLKHNLARVYIGKYDYYNAKKLLLELISETHPKIDVMPYYMLLLTLSIEDKQFDKAETYLAKLKSLDEEKPRFNLHYPESKILLNKNQPKKALAVLQNVVVKRPNAELLYQIGNVKFQMLDLEGAKQAFLKSLDIESDRAKVQQALAKTYVFLKEYEEAIDHALTSIELFRFYPEAHYTLGEALQGLGDLENAKNAFTTASMLVPKRFKKAEYAIENIEEKIAAINQDKPIQFIYKDNQIVIVSGLPRSGTSLMMQMLHNGGLEVLSDYNRKPDESNPKGYFEYDATLTLHKDNKWLHLAQDKAVKVVAPLLRFLDSKYRYKIIFMDRDLHEIIKSQRKMSGKDPEILPVRLLETYKKQLKAVNVWSDSEPSVDMITINYKDLLTNTKKALTKVSNFIGIDLDHEKMVSCVDQSLYRNRV